MFHCVSFPAVFISTSYHFVVVYLICSIRGFVINKYIFSEVMWKCDRTTIPKNHCSITLSVDKTGQ